jgi:hypothetical protein
MVSKRPQVYRFSVLLYFVECLVFNEYNAYVRYLYYSQYINKLATFINLRLSLGLTVIVYE